MTIGRSCSVPARWSGVDGRINRRKIEDNGDHRLLVEFAFGAAGFWRARRKAKGEYKENDDVRLAETGWGNVALVAEGRSRGFRKR
jgi:hypothetical protein